MPLLSVALKDIASRTELADALQVDVKALGLVVLKDASCTAPDCTLPAAESNKGRCILCQQSWFPRMLNSMGEKSAHCRGHGLFGPQFLRLYDGAKSPPATCCCSNALCEKIGYSHQGMFHPPTDEADCNEALRVLGVPAERRAKLVEDRRNVRIAPWHYKLRHRVMGENGKWELRRMAVYKDDDNKQFSFPPPNCNVQIFIDEEIPSNREYARGGYDDTLPPWFREMINMQEASLSRTDDALQKQDARGKRKSPPPVMLSTVTPARGDRSSRSWTPTPGGKRIRSATPTPAPGGDRSRLLSTPASGGDRSRPSTPAPGSQSRRSTSTPASSRSSTPAPGGDRSRSSATPSSGGGRSRSSTSTPGGNRSRSATPRGRRSSAEATEEDERNDEMRLLKAQLESALQRIKDLEYSVKMKDDEILEVRLRCDALAKENVDLKEKLAALEKGKVLLSYDELRPGGILADYVLDFTFFPDFQCNEHFLDALNFEPHNLCQNLVRYSTVSIAERKEYNDSLRASSSEEADGSSNNGVSDGGDAAADLNDIEDITISGEVSPPKRSGIERKLHWKTEYLVYCFYAHCNISMRRIACLFGVGPTLVHNIVYAWANLLCYALARLFPVPSRSQMLRAYPQSVIKKFGHAYIFLLLDATESYADVASMKTVNAILYSAYKHNSTLKWLVGCDAIGTVWNDSITDGYPGSISDPVQTAVTSILDQVPYGCAVEVDKGFLIDNDCALLGIVCIRPMKMLEKQTQQSKEDAALTQKVGKTRIPIEQANGQMKSKTSYFDRKIRVNQIGLADLIFRSSYLLTNFSLGFIQGRDDTDEPVERPCKAEIRWFGGTDDGLVDVRPMVGLWGTDTEIARWHELRDMEENKDKSDTDISEMVLDEDIPSQLREMHNSAVNTTM